MLQARNPAPETPTTEYADEPRSAPDVTSQVVERGPDPNFDSVRLAAVLGTMPGFCYTVDRDLVFRSSRGAGLRLLNLSDDQLVGVTLPELWGTSDPTYEPHACHLRALSGSTETYQDVCMGRSLAYEIRPLRDGSGSIVGVIGVGLDVTEREHAKEQQIKLATQLRQAQKVEVIGRLAGGVAHDFNNLLTSIMGNLSLAEMQLERTSPIRRYLASAGVAAESAATLTRQLLAFGRKQVIDPRPTNLSWLIEKIQGMLGRLLGESITLTMRCASDLWTVQADPGQLEQVLINLLVNARDAITGHGEIVVETENVGVASPSPFMPSTLEPRDYVMLTVSDTGRGMSEAVRAKLFEPFFTTKEVGAGTGLGLATVHGAVEQNGGAISVVSKLGEGSTFRIFLPRVEAEVQSSRATSVVQAQQPGGTETILLVEDEPLVLELADCTLQQLGYTVLPCASADEALRTVADHQGHIDLLVTDVVMPRINGKELAARVQALRSGIDVLFSSGYGEDIIARQGVLDAGLHFIGKPYRPFDLAAKVRAILDGRNAAKLAP